MKGKKERRGLERDRERERERFRKREGEREREREKEWFRKRQRERVRGREERERERERQRERERLGWRGREFMVSEVGRVCLTKRTALVCQLNVVLIFCDGSYALLSWYFARIDANANDHLHQTSVTKFFLYFFIMTFRSLLKNGSEFP